MQVVAPMPYEMNQNSVTKLKLLFSGIPKRNVTIRVIGVLFHGYRALLGVRLVGHASMVSIVK